MQKNVNQGKNKVENNKSVVDRTQLMATIGANLIKLRAAMDWKQTYMAKAMGVSVPALTNYTKGERQPEIQSLLMLFALPELKQKGLNLTMDTFLSPSFDPQKMIAAQSNAATEQGTTPDHPNVTGVYMCYYSVPNKSGYTQIFSGYKELRYGVLTVYEEYNPLTAKKTVKALAVFTNEREYAQVLKIKQDVDALYDSNVKDAKKAESIAAYYEQLKEQMGVYTGEISFGRMQMYVNIACDACDDCAHIILFKKGDAIYEGGLGSLNSVALGKERMLTGQKILLSRYVLGCAAEEIGRHLDHTVQYEHSTAKLDEMVQLSQKLYRETDGITSGLDDQDKVSVLQNRWNQLFRTALSQACSTCSVSEEEERRAHDLIRAYAPGAMRREDADGFVL